MPFAKRKPLRLKQWDYTSPGTYFVTFCTFDHKCTLGSIPEETLDKDNAVCNLSELGNMCQRMAALAFEGRTGTTLGSFVIMPNHVHALVSLSEEDASRGDLGRCIASWKALTTKAARKVDFNEKL